MSASIRIMHVISSLNRGGAELSLLSICRGAAARDARLTFKVVVLFDMQELTPAFAAAGIDTLCLRVPRNGFFTKLARTWRAIRRWRPHLVHTHLCYGDRHGQAAAILAGVKLRVSTVHNIDTLVPWQELCTRRLVGATATRVIAVSAAARAACARAYGCPAKKITVIHNAPSFTPREVAPRKHPGRGGPLKLVSVGTLREQKGHRYLIDAVEMLISEGIPARLAVYGADCGGMRARLMGSIRAKGLTDAVALMGATENVEQVLRQADVFVAASISEGFHMALVEAMSMGLPVAATDIPAHREVLGATDEQLFAAPASGRALADALRTLASDTDRYERLSRAGIERAGRFTEQAMIDSYGAFYGSLVDTAASGGGRA
ncbi:MAG: glycosyltransferase [Chitinivibrionales bacterium]|nr:glycosyltransferase [Chitinivibrionales bacterium]MBD3395928.1 glycosyltransferase [Chitinivibrionales bacterium]